MAQLTRSIASI